MSISEYWRPVIGFEGIYDVSSWGRVRRIKPQHGTQAGRILKGHNLHGYYHVYLSHNNKVSRRLIHRLVMQSFVGPSTLEVNHKDCNKLNNRLANLEYTTRQENAAHAKHNNCYARGERVTMSTLTRRQVRQIRRLRGRLTYKEIAARFGVTYSGIQGILCGRTWAWLN